ncbi:MAG: FG-GAP repeat domain-containing protein [Myxococcota bacterium]
MALLLTLLGCSEYELLEEKEPSAREDSDATGPPDPDTGATGLAACAWDEVATGAPIDESCLHEPVTGTLDTVVEWEVDRLDPFPEYGQVLMAPVVGNLTDDDGDGDVDADDVPDVAIVTDDDGADAGFPHGVLRILSGDTGEALVTVQVAFWGDSQVLPYRYSGAALGDVDGDALPDVITVASLIGGPPGDTGGGDVDTADTGAPGDDTDDVPVIPPPPSETSEGGCYPVAWEADGTVKWVATGALLPCGGHAPALADMEGDGAVEVLVGATILAGADGAVRSAGGGGVGRYEAFAEVGYMSFASDLDGDGVQELVAGSTLYDANGAAICTAQGDDGFGAAADFDGDGLGEVVVVGNGGVRLFDHACAVRASWPLDGSGNGGPPTIADFDGDGVPEIGAASAAAYAVYEADGTLLWSAPITDASSHTTGSSVFDFDGDGRAEVVYADETTLWIFDGGTGEVRLADDRHSSRTLHELPVIVDVDGDGLTEIVVPNGGGHHEDDAGGLYVLGSADGSWLGNRPVWNQHAYDLVHVDDDLGVPSAPASNWPTWNTFRSGDVAPISGGASPDAVPIAGVCRAECDAGTLVVGVRVGNGGMAALRAGVPVAVYYEGNAGAVGVAFTDTVVAPGEASGIVEVRVDADVAEVRGVRVVADDDGSGGERVAECHEGDLIVLEGPFCE